MLPSVTNEPTSPCKKICKLSACGQLCVGCGRTLEEIADWSSFSVSRKLQVIDNATQRIKETAPSWSE
ncbi:MAG: DUF1289 domain-containing protein [Pseudomonadota bacterium]